MYLSQHAPRFHCYRLSPSIGHRLALLVFQPALTRDVEHDTVEREEVLKVKTQSEGVAAYSLPKRTTLGFPRRRGRATTSTS